jgi:hypothetical protein
MQETGGGHKLEVEQRFGRLSMTPGIRAGLPIATTFKEFPVHKRKKATGPTGGTSSQVEAVLLWAYGNNMVTTLAMSAQFRYNVKVASQCRNWLNYRTFTHHRNASPMLPWRQTNWIQNPVRFTPRVGSSPHLRQCRKQTPYRLLR